MLLRFHGCSVPVVSGRCCLEAGILVFWLFRFLHTLFSDFFSLTPGLGVVLCMQQLGTGTTPVTYSPHLTLVHLCNGLRLLPQEASFMRGESYSCLWV